MNDFDYPMIANGDYSDRASSCRMHNRTRNGQHRGAATSTSLALLTSDGKGEGGDGANLLAPEIEPAELEHQEKGCLRFQIAVVNVEPVVTIPYGEVGARGGSMLAPFARMNAEHAIRGRG